MSETPSWSPYVVLGGTVLGAVLEIVAFVIFTYLLIKYIIRKSSLLANIEISSSMILYMVFEVICGFWLSLYLGYISVFWHYSSKKYNGYLLFILGAFQVVSITCKPITVFFLGLDKVCCILFPFTYVGKKRRFPIFGTFVLIFVVIVIALVTRIIPNWPKTEETSCSSFGCLTSPQSGEIYTLQRFICSGGNMVVGILLAILVSKKLKNANAVKVQSNQLAVITLSLTFVLDLLPHIIGTVFIQVLHINPTVYVGPYSSILGTLESFVCAIIYLRAFNRASRKSRKIKTSLESKNKLNSFIIPVRRHR